jgi:hypothetical protein
MVRVGAAIILLAGLAACDAKDASRKAIVDQCVADGMAAEVCDCLGNESVARLDPELLDIVVLGTEGRQAEADAKITDLDPQLRAKFTAEVPAIVAKCGVGAPDPAS